MTRILLTGSNSFLGRHLSSKFRQLKLDYYPAFSKAYDLRQRLHIDALFKHTKPDIVFHLAAHVGGIHYNIANPATLYYDNVMMNTQLIHKAALSGVKKFVFVSSACIYSDKCSVPMRPHMIWWDYPEPTNGTYGLSKRIALAQLQAYKKQFGMNFEYPIFANMYGPSDHFEDDRSHVIPALIKRFVEAKQAGIKTAVVWGSGNPTRDFLYVEDGVNALVKFLDIDLGEAINIANGDNVRIDNLALMIARLTGFEGNIEFDTSKPDGQMDRAYDVKPAKRELNWQAKIDLEEGLKRTIDWYGEN